MTTPEQLRKAYDRLQVASDLRVLTSATIGRKNPDGSVSLSVPGRKDYVHITLGISTGSDTHVARNDAGVPRRFGLPIKVRLEEGVYVVKGADPHRAYAFTGGSTGLQPTENHMIGSGNEYMVEMLRIEAGMFRWDHAAGGLNVWVNPFRYHAAGVYQTFPGGSIDLAPYQPGTAGEWAWVLVGVDPATNALIAAAGAAISVNFPLAPADLDDIDFAAYIAVGAVKVRADATELKNILDYTDAKAWLGGRPGGEYLALAGSAGGQTAAGGTEAGEDLILESTEDPDKGTIILEPTGAAEDNWPRVAIGASSVPTDVNLYLTGINGAWMLLNSGAGRAQLWLRTVGTQVTRFVLEQQEIERWEIGMAADSSGNLNISSDLNGIRHFLTLTPTGNQIAYFAHGGQWVGSLTDLDGTAVELIPDDELATSVQDVANLLTYRALVKPSTGAAISATGEIVPGASADLYNVGSDILTLTVAADGSISIQRTGGTLTYSARLTLDWI